MKHKNKNSKQEKRRLQVLKAAKKYKKTAKGKKTAEKYEKSDKGKHRKQKYQNSEKKKKIIKKAKRELEYYKNQEEDPFYTRRLWYNKENNTEWWQNYVKRVSELRHTINS